MNMFSSKLMGLALSLAAPLCLKAADPGTPYDFSSAPFTNGSLNGQRGFQIEPLTTHPAAGNADAVIALGSGANFTRTTTDGRPNVIYSPNLVPVTNGASYTTSLDFKLVESTGTIANTQGILGLQLTPYVNEYGGYPNGTLQFQRVGGTLADQYQLVLSGSGSNATSTSASLTGLTLGLNSTAGIYTSGNLRITLTTTFNTIAKTQAVSASIYNGATPLSTISNTFTGTLYTSSLIESAINYRTSGDGLSSVIATQFDGPAMVPEPSGGWFALVGGSAMLLAMVRSRKKAISSPR